MAGRILQNPSNEHRYYLYSLPQALPSVDSSQTSDEDRVEEERYSNIHENAKTYKKNVDSGERGMNGRNRHLSVRRTWQSAGHDRINDGPADQTLRES